MALDTILSIIRHFLVCILLVSSILLWLQRRVDTKPRICLMIFLLVSAFGIAQGLYTTYMLGVPATYYVLSIANMNSGFLELLLLYLYPIAVINSKWLTVKRVFLLLFPWLVICFVQIAALISFRNLSTFSEILEYIGEFNVWIRVLIMFVVIVPYSVMLLYIAYKWQYSRIGSKWIYQYALGVQIMGLMFWITILTGSMVVKSIHLLYGSVFCLYVAYHELFLRLFPASVDVIRLDVMSGHNSEKLEQATSSPLWERLSIMMSEKELWRELDITLEDLARRLNTNRTTLSALIHQHGYLCYTEYINRQRIDAFVEKVHNSSSINIQELFYDVGFRSKSTALRNFRLYMGCTPSEYIQQIISKNRLP